jgi:hypothetical protein
MAVDKISLPVSRQETILSTRQLGTIGMIAAPMLFVEGMLRTFGYGESANGRWIGLLGLAYLTGWACSLTGMRRLRATGRGALSTAVFCIQLTGLLLAFLFNVQEIAGANPDTPFFQITDIAWPASHILMLFLGVLVLKARVWRGWRTIAPFLCGLALPVFFAVKAIAGVQLGGILFGISTTVAFMLLGYAVRTDKQSASSH